MNNEFKKYAVKHLGMNSSQLESYINITSQGYISPTIIEERQLNVAQMDVFSRLMMDRIIFLGTAIDDYTANVIQAQLLYLDSSDPGKDISIYINSPGGSVTAGMSIYDTMQFIKPDVSTMCIGQAASMGAFLLAGGTKGKRFCLPNSRMMIHQPLGGFQGQASDIEIHTREILGIRDKLNKLLAHHTGQTIKTIAKDTDRDNFMDGKSAVDYGLIDAVLDKRSD